MALCSRVERARSKFRLLLQQTPDRRDVARDDGVGGGFERGDSRVRLRERFDVLHEDRPTREAMGTGNYELRIGQRAARDRAPVSFCRANSLDLVGPRRDLTFVRNASGSLCNAASA